MTTKKTTHQTSGKTNQRKSFGRINRPASGQRSNVAPAGNPTRIDPLRVQATAGKQNINQPKKTGQRFYHPQKKKKETISQQKFTLQTVGGSSSKTLKIIPLGGCEEVGRNKTIFEYDQDIVILDMSMQFPEEDMAGIDYIIPNISYLK